MATARGRARTLLLGALVVTVLPLMPARADAQAIALRTVSVNCGVAGQTINGALRRQVLGGALLVRITGVCNEHVDIFRDDVILRGVAAGATIHGPTTTDQTVLIDGAKRVHIEDLVITGGSDGISGVRGASFFLDNVTVDGAARLGVVASYNASAVLDGCTIRKSGSNGLTAANASTVVVTNSLIEQNSTGISASRASHVRVGQNNNGTALGAVTVQGNTNAGINILDASAAIVLASTIQNNGGNGIYIARGSTADIGIGSFNMVGPNTITNNGASSTGILVEGASATIVGNTITGNGFGVQFINGGNGRLGIRPDTIYLGNDISANKLTGVIVNSGSTAVIGGNGPGGVNPNGRISGNGVGATPGNRFGIFVSQGAANLIGQNLVENHLDSGIFVRQGSLFLGNGFGALDTGGNVIKNNGGGPESSSTRSGIFLFDGATAEIRAATLTGNAFANLQVFQGGAAEVRNSTLTAPVVDPVSSGGGFNIQLGTRGSARITNGTVLDGAPADGVSINNGASFEIRNDVASTISNSGGFPINCFGGEASIVFPGSGAVPIFTGNAGGNAPAAGCTGF